MSRDVTKIVRFYDPVIVDQQGTQSHFAQGFWRDLEPIVHGASVAERTIHFNGEDYFGFCQTAKSPATRYVKIGKQRTRADQPDTVNTESGSETPLLLPENEKLFEATFILPFGARNRVAVLNHTFGSPRIGAVERWLTTITGQLDRDTTVELQPVIDADLVQKLENSIGATTLEVKLPPGSREFATREHEHLGVIEKAVVEATKTTSEMSASLRWSSGHGTPNPLAARELLRAGKALFNRDQELQTLKIGLMLPMADGAARVEQLNLLEEKITANATYTVRDDEQVTDLSLLAGMNKAIEDFNLQVG